MNATPDFAKGRVYLVEKTGFSDLAIYGPFADLPSARAESGANYRIVSAATWNGRKSIKPAELSAVVATGSVVYID